DSAIKCNEQDAIEVRFGRARLTHGDRSSLIDRGTVDTAADRRKRDRVNLMLAPERERSAITRREQRRLVVRAAPPDRTSRVNHVPRSQIEAGCDTALPGRTSHVRPHFGNGQTRFIESMARGPMNRSVDAATAEHPLVGRVDDGINVELRDVAADDFDQGRNSGRDTGMPGHGMEMMNSTSAIPYRII